MRAISQGDRSRASGWHSSRFRSQTHAHHNCEELFFVFIYVPSSLLGWVSPFYVWPFLHHHKGQQFRLWNRYIEVSHGTRWCNPHRRWWFIFLLLVCVYRIILDIVFYLPHNKTLKKNWIIGLNKRSVGNAFQCSRRLFFVFSFTRRFDSTQPNKRGNTSRVLDGLWKAI